MIDPINGASHPTSFSYDAMSRLTGITYPDSSVVSFTYDVRGRRITSTDQNHKTTYYTYDDADRLSTVTDPANNTTQYAYDTEDNLLSITDANNHATSFVYNARGWVTQTTFPSTLAEYYAYDQVGNLKSKTDRKNQTIQYVYDGALPAELEDVSGLDHRGICLRPSGQGAAGERSDRDLQLRVRQHGTADQHEHAGCVCDRPGLHEWLFLRCGKSNRTSLTAPDGTVSTYGYDTLNRLNWIVELLGRIVRLRLRPAEPPHADDAAERREHELQLRFGFASALGAAPGGSKHLGRCELHV